MKHKYSLIIASVASAFISTLCAEELLPSVEISPKWITIRSEFQSNGRSLPYTTSIRKDTIVAVYEQNMEQQLVETAWPATPPDTKTRPVSLVICTNVEPSRFQILGLTGATAPLILKKILGGLETQGDAPLPDKQEKPNKAAQPDGERPSN